MSDYEALAAEARRPVDIYAGAVAGTSQLDPAESLTAEIGQDPLDAGYSPPDYEPFSARHVRTQADELRGESLDERLVEEEPDIEVANDSRTDPSRNGRLISLDAGLGLSSDADDNAGTATDVGYAGWAFSAEEAAMHIVDDSFEQDI